MVNRKIKKTHNLEDCSSYDIFRKKLYLLEGNTNISDAQKGNLIIQSLTDTSKFKKNLSAKVKAFLDTELKEGDLEKAVKKWRDLRSYRRKKGENIEDYMDRFEPSYLDLKGAMPATEILQEP